MRPRDFWHNANVAIVGLGLMGSAVADRLIASGVRVSGHDIDPVAEDRAVRFGVRVVDRHELSLANTILTSLPDDAAAKRVLIGKNGLVQQLAPGSRIVDLSTIMPATIRQISSIARARDVRVVDCAVTGGPAEARAGTLGLLVGGSHSDLEALAPLLSRIGRIIFEGDVGDGKTVKLVNNVMTMGNILVAAEAFSLGVRLGISPADLFEALAAAGGTSHQFMKRFPNVIRRDFQAGFPMRLGLKDLQLAMAVARQKKMPMRTVAAIRRLYSAAARLTGGEEDIVGVIQLFESESPRKEPE